MELARDETAVGWILEYAWWTRVVSALQTSAHQDWQLRYELHHFLGVAEVPIMALSGSIKST